MEWIYATFKNGYLYDDAGYKLTGRKFASEQEAAQWIEDNDERITLR